MKVIVVGGVAGGASTATRLRRLDENAEIIMVEKGPYISFSNCGLPYYVGNVIEEREKLLVQTVEGMNKKYNLDIRINSEVVSVDKENKEVEIVKDGQAYKETYDYLVLSPGAKPYVPNIKGIDSEKVFTLRNISDVDNITEYVNSNDVNKVTVIGAGYVGLEMAENLRKLGKDVTIVELADQILSSFDKEMTKKIELELERNEINVMLKENAIEFKDSSLIFESGKSLDVDMVVLSIGVTPDTKFIQESGIDVTERGHVIVNDSMQTSNEFIYAVGDAVEIKDSITGDKIVVPLAGPASKQGRIAADNICGRDSKYKGTQVTSIIKVFDYVLAGTGLSEKTLKAKGIDYQKSYTHSNSHAKYYPGAEMMMIKLLFEKENGHILGASIIGKDGVDKRIDILATAIHSNLTVFDLEELDLAYAPPFSSSKTPVNMAGFVASNIVRGDVKVLHVDQLNKINKNDYILIDVRPKEAFDKQHIEGAVNIPLGVLREKINIVPKNKKILINCRIGLTAYLACCIFKANGYDVYNLSGGILTYNCY